MNYKINLVLLLFAVLIMVSCTSNADKEENDNLTINVTEAKSSVMIREQEFSFISKPFRSSILSFRVGGPIINFDVYVGNYYKKDEIIAEIDNRDFLIRKEQSEAKYMQMKAEYERVKVLYEKGNVALSTYEATKANYINAKTNDETRTNELFDTKLKAPFDGYIGDVFIEKHQDVKATQAIVSFVDVSKLKIEFYVTQDFAFKAQGLKTIDLYFDAMPNKIYKAELVETSKSSTSNNLSYLFTAIIPNNAQSLLAGMSGKAILNISDTTTKNILIPQSAVCHNPNDGDYIWLVDKTKNTVSKQKIEIGDILNNGYISINDGLNDGDIIATSALRFLANDMKINIVK